MKIFIISQNKRALIDFFGVAEEFAEEIESILAMFPNNSPQKRKIMREIKKFGISTQEDLERIRNWKNKLQNNTDQNINDDIDIDILNIIHNISDNMEYRQWLVKTYQLGLWQKNDAFSLKEQLSNFSSLKDRGLLQVQIRDIKSPAELFTLINQNYNEINSVELESLPSTGWEIVKKYSKDDQEIIIMHITEHQVLEFVGKGTNWCVANDFSSWEDYEPNFFCIFINGKAEALIHPENSEFKNRTDSVYRNYYNLELFLDELIPLIENETGQSIQSMSGDISSVLAYQAAARRIQNIDDPKEILHEVGQDSLIMLALRPEQLKTLDESLFQRMFFVDEFFKNSGPEALQKFFFNLKIWNKNLFDFFYEQTLKWLRIGDHFNKYQKILPPIFRTSELKNIANKIKEEIHSAIRSGNIDKIESTFFSTSMTTRGVNGPLSRYIYEYLMENEKDFELMYYNYLVRIYDSDMPKFPPSISVAIDHKLRENETYLTDAYNLLWDVLWDKPLSEAQWMLESLELLKQKISTDLQKIERQNHEWITRFLTVVENKLSQDITLNYSYSFRPFIVAWGKLHDLKPYMVDEQKIKKFITERLMQSKEWPLEFANFGQFPEYFDELIFKLISKNPSDIDTIFMPYLRDSYKIKKILGSNPKYKCYDIYKQVGININENI